MALAVTQWQDQATGRRACATEQELGRQVWKEAGTSSLLSGLVEFPDIVSPPPALLGLGQFEPDQSFDTRAEHSHWLTEFELGLELSRGRRRQNRKPYTEHHSERTANNKRNGNEWVGENKRTHVPRSSLVDRCTTISLVVTSPCLISSTFPCTVAHHCFESFGN